MTHFASIYKTGFGDPKPEKTKPKEKKPLKKVSEKRKVENKEYTILRKVYLESHPLCEVKFEGCTKNQLRYITTKEEE